MFLNSLLSPSYISVGHGHYMYFNSESISLCDEVAMCFSCVNSDQVRSLEAAYTFLVRHLEYDIDAQEVLPVMMGGNCESIGNSEVILGR